jgi:hypothetical protein
MGHDFQPIRGFRLALEAALRNVACDARDGVELTKIKAQLDDLKRRVDERIEKEQKR